MINVFKIRKLGALMLMGLMPAMFLFILTTFYNFWTGLGGLAVALLVFYLAAVMLLKNPFTDLVEGKGILAINMDSTGVLRPFIVYLKSPYIRGKIDGNEVNDVWDREATFNLAPPVKAGTAQKIEYIKDDKTKSFFHISLTEEEYNQGRFALFHYPVILWNQQTNSLLTKDFFSDKEKSAFADHGVLYLNRKMEELTSAMLNFGRYVIEQLKPKTSLFGNTWVWIIVVVLVVILIALFAPAVINSVKGAAGAAGGAIGGAGAAITPRG